MDFLFHSTLEFSSTFTKSLNVYFIKHQSNTDWVSLPHIFQFFILSNFVVYKMSELDILMVLCIWNFAMLILNEGLI